VVAEPPVRAQPPLVSLSVCVILRAFAPLVRWSRGFATQNIKGVVWDRRLAPVPHHTLNQASAAGASQRV